MREQNFFLIIFVFYLSLLLFSCNSEPEKNGNSVNLDSIASANGMRSSEPVVVDIPQSLNDSSWKKDTSLYVINILKDKIEFEHASIRIQIASCKEFGLFLKKKDGQKLNGKIVLKTDSLSSFKLIDSVVKVLKYNNVFQFDLISDLEK